MGFNFKLNYKLIFFLVVFVLVLYFFIVMYLAFTTEIETENNCYNPNNNNFIRLNDLSDLRSEFSNFSPNQIIIVINNISHKINT